MMGEKKEAETKVTMPTSCRMVQVKREGDDEWLPAVCVRPSKASALELRRPELGYRIDVEVFGAMDDNRQLFNVPYGEDGYEDIAAWRWPPRT